MEEKKEGGIGEEEEGASKQHIYICISTLDLVIRQKKNQLPPKTLSGHFTYSLFFSNIIIWEWLPIFSEAYLNSLGQLVDCRELCAQLVISILI